MKRIAWVMAAGSSLLGCVFLMDLPGGELDQCFFNGAARACGACLRRECTAPIDACCGDATCVAEMGEVDRCAESGTCSSLASGSRSLVTVSKCAMGRCKDVCGAPPAVPTPPSPEAGTTFCQAGVTSCSCSVTAPPNNVRCGSSIRDPLCCAEATWPAENSQCVCRPISCHQQGATCSCDTANSANFSSASCTGRVCCASAESCTCYERDACPNAGDVVVDRCDPAKVPCSAGSARVNLCVP